MNKLLYYFLRIYVWCALHIYFKKIIARQTENIPRKGPVLFLANHQNALLDALVIAVTAPRYCYFIARADVFKNSIAARLLSLINMRPVYRLRDGIKSIPNNKYTFTWASSVLLRNECLLFFPEGNHSLLRRVRPLSKGFTRIVGEALVNNPSLDLQIIPVGINYTNHTGFRGSVSIYYGKPVGASLFKNNLLPLRDAVEEKLKSLTTHVEDEATYHKVIGKLEQTLPDYLDPIETNRRIRLIEEGLPVDTAVVKRSSKSPFRYMLYPLYWLCLLVNVIPLLLWKWLKKKITDPVFTGTIRFAVGITVVPATYMTEILTIGAYSFSGGFALGVFCLLSLPLGFYLKKQIA
ncbi:MAG: 1-acyl-sn-glycerol-3-phosphate acyltransferase [Flammeovirgaceae bacterium]|nr:MAG: 1-acyl-sn-glycerol-3-phosphate acyltransferase [Flammeovirgaceae bacterium]